MWAVQLVVLFFASLFFTWLVTPLISRLVTSLGILDFPDTIVSGEEEARKVHQVPIPRLGGVAIVGGFFLGVFLVSPQPSINGIYLCSALMFLTGVVDDIRQLSAKSRLFIQLGVAGLTVYLNNLAFPAIVIGSATAFSLPTWLGFVISVLMIVGAINSINMIDGLDGLASGITMIGVCLLSLMYFKAAETFDILFFTIPLMGSILGFLRYNTYPASVFMGDGGSNWLGFMVGVLLVLVGGGFSLSSPEAGQLISSFQPIASWNVPFVSALLCVAVPILDTAVVIVLRWKNGMSPMTADKRHLHHTLLKYGLGHSESVIAIYFIAFTVGIAGLLPVTNPGYQLVYFVPYIAIFLFMLFLSFLYKTAGKECLPDSQRPLLSFLNRERILGRNLRRVLRSWETINRYIIYTVIFVVTIVSAGTQSTFGYLAGIMASLLLVTTFFSKKKTNFFDSLILALSLTLLVFTNNQESIYVEIMGNRLSLQILYNILFVLLFASSVVHLLVIFRRRYLVVTPSDFLLVLVPSILLFVPAQYRDEHNLTIIFLRSLVLFIALRGLVSRHQQVLTKIKFVTSASLVLVFLKSVLALKIIY